VTRARLPGLGAALPWLSAAANRSRLWLALAAALAVLGGRGGRRAAARGVAAVGATSLVVNGPVKAFTGRHRPALELVPEIRRLTVSPTSTSFPSGHAASAFAFATAVGMHQPRLRWPLLGLAGVVGLSRVYTGVHYPGDVIVGGLLGAGIGGVAARMPRAPRAPRARASGRVIDEAPVEPDGSGLVLVANVSAGNALGREPQQRLCASLPGTRILEAEVGEQLPSALRRAALEARVLGVAGGDGSVSAAAQAASERDLPLLIVPGGTLNHFARDVGMEEVDSAVDAVREGRTIRIDLGEIDGRPFVNAASIGMYPALVAAREELESRIGKWPAALWCGLRLLLTEVPTHVMVDGHRRRLWLLWIGNGRFVDHGVVPHGRDRLDEGVLDVRVVGAERSWARTRLAFALLLGRVDRSPVYERWIASEVRIQSLQGPLQLAKDGESWPGPAQLTARTRSGALRLLQPTERATPRA
jgi:diacylglycerol kinase family enzyme/membrane-associated phospholipid phosphatase